MLDDGAQGVAVRGDHDGLAGLDRGNDGLIPVGQQTRDDVLEALAHGDELAGVARVGVLRELRASLDGGRGHVEGTAPQHELVLAVLVADFLLVLALERTVVTLVEAPVALNGDPVAIGGVEGEVRGHDGATQHRREQEIRENAGFLEELTTVGSLRAALVRQRNIHPTGEEVLCIPFALAVAEQHQFVAHVSILPQVPTLLIHPVGLITPQLGHGTTRETRTPPPTPRDLTPIAVRTKTPAIP